MLSYRANLDSNAALSPFLLLLLLCTTVMFSLSLSFSLLYIIHFSSPTVAVSQHPKKYSAACIFLPTHKIPKFFCLFLTLIVIKGKHRLHTI